MGSKHAVKFSKSTWHQIKIRERKGPLRGIIPKCEPHERSPCSPKFVERSHEETLHQERCARKVAWDSAKNIFRFKNADKTTFYSSIEAKRMPALTSKSPEEQEFVVDSGASMHMMSKKVLSSDELDTLGRSRNSTVVVTANGEVQTKEEAQSHVHDLDLFVTVQLLEETSAVPSLPKKGRQLYAKRTISVTLVVQGYPPILKAFRLQHRRCRICVQQIQPKERSDVQAPGNWSASLPKSPIKKKKEGCEIRTTVCEVFLNGWRSSQMIWRTQNCMHPHTLLRTQSRNVLRKWYQNQGSTGLFTHFPND